MGLHLQAALACALRTPGCAPPCAIHEPSSDSSMWLQQWTWVLQGPPTSILCALHMLVTAFSGMLCGMLEDGRGVWFGGVTRQEMLLLASSCLPVSL